MTTVSGVDRLASDGPTPFLHLVFPLFSLPFKKEKGTRKKSYREKKKISEKVFHTFFPPVEEGGQIAGCNNRRGGRDNKVREQQQQQFKATKQDDAFTVVHGTVFFQIFTTLTPVVRSNLRQGWAKIESVFSRSRSPLK